MGVGWEEERNLSSTLKASLSVKHHTYLMHSRPGHRALHAVGTQWMLPQSKKKVREQVNSCPQSP